MGNIQRLIAFDLDGTLIDSRRDLADAANDLIAELGGSPLPEDAIAAMVGEGATLLVRRALTAAGLAEPPDAVARFLAFYDARLLNYTRPYPGIVDVVRLAREARARRGAHQQAEASNRTDPRGAGMRDLFDDVIGGDGPLPRKPDPAALFTLMEAAGAGRHATLLVAIPRSTSAPPATPGRAAAWCRSASASGTLPRENPTRARRSRPTPASWRTWFRAFALSPVP